RLRGGRAVSYPCDGMVAPSSRSPAVRDPGAKALALALLLGAAVVGGGTSCLLELDDAISCGDGYHDLYAGEECDPGDPRSFATGCRETSRPNGEAACDPQDCTIIRTPQQCAVCNDGFLDSAAGEECDGDMLGGQTCPGGRGSLGCTNCRLDYSECESCGNGVVEPQLGEECDPNLDDITQVRTCRDNLESLSNSGDYAGGVFLMCRDDCLWSRVGCNYCGNGEINGALPVDLEGNMAPAEICDGHVFDEDDIREQLGSSVCYDDERLRPHVRCTAGCQEIQPAEAEQLCCLRKEEACPLPGAALRCCFELEVEAEAEDQVVPCQDRINPVDGSSILVCR
ncbi:MAG: hypothetical protein AB1Z98_19050, partial [Nannocystaceae bacterium]